ncbi:Electron transfer flavoprotein alpha/beta-subunit [Desulfarculus baarsii DSM 2075]|uniref:Electron transfer flavoprotein subunit alpha n=1 Tax=Desulfarculus baarsii (strain ATCC 33931 / DSM 2075 / LMG 7858 / VKM B-1802 / 2st14) TaxID=644282 RepID=E1QKM8_DESB2|nr:electron transfer flavoprotein subunit alpha/FixB family protein [Desulfarculus baarsii]ADK86237.1 Electron transfer flavoprotein alpha/beta-subunit [Desulfarculus baarsii DSM 2075]
MAGVYVVAEHRDGAFRKVTLEAASAAKKIADELGSEVTAVVLASGMADACAELGKYGVSKVLYADDAAFAQYTTDAYANALAELLKDADVVVFGASMQGKDLAGRLAAKLDTSVAVDCTALAVEGGKVKATRPIYAGKVYADIVINAKPQMVTLRPNVFDVVEVGGQAAVETISATAGEVKTKVVDVVKDAGGKIDLTEALVIISGGRGMKDGANFEILETLAGQLNGAVGASRSAVDAGWRPHRDQVGQTGKVVTPNLYIACGISGAIQHLAGMGSSKVIVAINKDADAPIFQKADFCVVADLFDVVPAFTEEVKKLG